MEGERARAPSLPDTHGRIGGGRGGGLEKEEEDTGSRPSSIPLPQKESSDDSTEFGRVSFGNSERQRWKISDESQSSQESECMSCESFEWGKR